MYHKIEVGIEHLMTGICFFPKPDHAVQFIRVSASIVAAISDEPFTAHWPNRCHMESTPYEFRFEQSGQGTVDWYAKVLAGVMQDAEQRLYDMQTYNRTAMYTGLDGQQSRYAPNEPSPFPQAVVNAMRNKHGAEAEKYLAMLRWSFDHWGYSYAGMYLGVEPDGYIHS